MMARYVVLLNFTEKGMSGLKESVSRAESFGATAEKMGAKVLDLYWTLGIYDGVLILEAPDEAIASALVIEFGRGNDVKSCMLRAFDAEEFKAIVGKVR
ncbi:MAG: GYD domain-containing protein [Phycisphaerae bacterium]|jgi:uncharacterized protein with GYD domain